MTAPDIKALCERLRNLGIPLTNEAATALESACAQLAAYHHETQEARKAHTRAEIERDTAYARGLEDAAKVCENAYGPWDETKDAATNMAWNRREMAQAIRAKIKEAG